MDLQAKIADKSAVIGIVGLGHTGLSLAHDFAATGFKVIGYDIDKEKIAILKRGESYLHFLPTGHLFSLIRDKLFIPTGDALALQAADVVIISVPTPLGNDRLPNLSALQQAATVVASVLHKEMLVVVQSTSYPGTTEEVVLSLLEKGTALKVGKDFFVAHVPEREDAGNPRAILTQIPRICGGVTPTCGQLAKQLYEHITIQVHLCSSARVAEASKVFENAFRLINIAFVDEMKLAFEKMGINIWEVIQAASTKPFGFSAFYPGPGIGGECIPVDPVYLSWKGKEYGATMSMIDTAAAVNNTIPQTVVEKIRATLQLYRRQEAHAGNQPASGGGAPTDPLQGAKILILGVAFKKDVADTRESPALKLIPMLQAEGASVSYNDPYVPALPAFHLRSVPLDSKGVEEFDCVVVVSDHSRYDWEWLCKHSHCLVDTRNATQHVDKNFKNHVVL